MCQAQSEQKAKGCYNPGMDLFGNEAPRPWADRLRPASLDEFVGQEHVTGPGQLLRTIIEQGKPISLILWGPPGTGKTTLARIIAQRSGLAFEEISAVTSGLPEVKKVIERARERRRAGQGTLLFVDEIHRFNKAQQDAFLPHMESGLITLIGATTENPSFEVVGPLLSRRPGGGAAGALGRRLGADHYASGRGRGGQDYSRGHQAAGGAGGGRRPSGAERAGGGGRAGPG